jgi:adenylate cyclase
VDAPDPAVEAPASLDVPALLEQVEQMLVGGAAKYTREQMAQRSKLTIDEASGLWRALGFASVPDDEVAFTEDDLIALEDVKRIRDLAGLDDDTLRAMTRIMGQTFARLASWQGQMVLDVLSRSPEMLASSDRIVDLIEELKPLTLEVNSYVWRRQVAAYWARVGSNVAGGGWADAAQTRAVGFADMTEFTSLTRRSTEAELQRVLERFESIASEVVGTYRGQVVKTIGDEVLFAADTPADAAEIALDLLARADEDDLLPSLRVGVASGSVVSRLGDVFGATVNIASRLTGLARPGSALADRTMSEALADDDRFTLHPLRAEHVRGYGHLRPWRLRRASDSTPR